MVNKIITWISNKLANLKQKHFGLHVLIIFFFILPLLIVASFSIFNSYKHLTDATLERRGTIAYLAASTMHERLDRIIDVGVSLSSRVQFQKLVEEGKWDEAVKIMENAPKNFPYIDRIHVFDKQGVLRSATNIVPELIPAIGQNFSYRDYYQGVSRNWKPYIAEAIKPAVPLGYNLVPVAIPIKSESGQITGFLLLTVKLDTVVSWAKNINVGPGGFVYIVDQKGHLIAHPTLLPSEDVIDFSSVLTVQKVLKGEGDVEVIFNSIENENRLVAYEPVSDYGWGIVVAQPTEDAFADRNREIMKLSLFYGILLLFGFIFGHLFLKLLHAINHQRQKERILLESIGDGVIAIDRYWNITLWNKSAEKISGWKSEEVLGKPFRSVVKLVRERDRKENIAFIEEAIVYGRTGFLENHTVMLAKDGREVPIGDSAAPIFDASGTVAGAILVFRDVSTEKESSALKSDFAYASHQLNTPVTKTLWNLEGAMEEKDIVKMKEKVGIAYQSAKSIQKLNTQLYVVSEIDQKVIIPRYENSRISDLVTDLIKETEDKCKECQVKITVEPISPVFGLKTDTKILKRILAEIIENGVIYGKPGGKVSIKVNTQEDSVLFEIMDSGIGVDDSQKTLIFTKFFRGNNFDATKIIGAGLGLYIAREYIKLLKGKIWFESEKEKGTTFYVSLPAT